MSKAILLVLSIVCFSSLTHAQTVFTTRAPASSDDKRGIYINDLLQLALKKTEDKYGGYVLKTSLPGANNLRAMSDLQNGKYENYFIRESITAERLEELEAVPFPVELGLVGYRIGFISNRIKTRITKELSLTELKQFSIIQGGGWLDTKILEWNGFYVEKVGSYESMFHMVAKNRGDIFFRGANELFDEWQANKHIPNLKIEESIVLYYPLPRFFFTQKGNTKNAERIFEGLKLAYADGSLIELWEQTYGHSLKFANLENRNVHILENPFLIGIDKEYEKYFYRPASIPKE